MFEAASPGIKMASDNLEIRVDKIFQKLGKKEDNPLEQPGKPLETPTLFPTSKLHD